MNIRRLPPDLLGITLAMFIANVANFMYYPVLALYLEKLGATVEEVGIFFTVQIILAIIFRILGGWLSDHSGRLFTIGAGSMLVMLGFYVFALSGSWEWLLLAALVTEWGGNMIQTSSQAYVGENAPPGTEGMTFGLTNGVYLLCMIIGPLLGGYLIEAYSYKTMFWTGAGLYTTATILRLWIARHSPPKVENLHLTQLVTDLRGFFVMLFAGGLLMWLFLTDGFIDAGTQLAMPFFPKYATESANLGETGYSALFAWMAVIGAFGMIPAGMFSDKYGERIGIAVGVSFYCLTWLLVIAMPTVPSFVIAFASAGIAQAFVEPAFASLISKTVPKSSLGMAWGVFLTALGFMAVPAPFIGGLLYDQVRPEATFILAAVLMLIAAPLALWKLRRPDIKA